MVTGENFFVHNTELRPTLPPLGPAWMKPVLYTGEYVEFSVSVNPANGRPCAVEVTGLNGDTLLMDHGIMVYQEYRSGRGLERDAGFAAAGPAAGPAVAGVAKRT